MVYANSLLVEKTITKIIAAKTIRPITPTNTARQTEYRLRPFQYVP